MARKKKSDEFTPGVRIKKTSQSKNKSPYIENTQKKHKKYPHENLTVEQFDRLKELLKKGSGKQKDIPSASRFPLTAHRSPLTP